MQGMHRLQMIAAIGTLALVPGMAWPGTPAPGALRVAALSAELYSRGIAAGDALAVLVAAHLRKGLNATPAAPAGGAAPAEPGPDTGFLDWQVMLEAGRMLAADDPMLASLADDIAAGAGRGVSTGPIYRIAAVEGESRAKVAELYFSGGAYAEAYVEAAPGIDLDLYIRDEAGLVVCKDTGGYNIGYCGWTPAEDGTFTVEVVNGSPGPAEYTLMTN